MTSPPRSRAGMLLAPAETASLVLGGLVGLVGAIWIWLTLSLGAGLLVLVVGVVFLGLALFGSAWLSRFHRARIAGLLGVVIPEPSLPATPGWRGRAALFARATTWRQLAYHGLVAPILLFTSALLVLALWGNAVALLVTAAMLVADPAGSGPATPFVAFLGWPGALGLGVVLALLTPQLARGLSALDLALARPLLGRTTAEQLAPRVTALEKTRAGVIDAADAERRRIERDLHDGAQQRLTSLALNLGMARSALPPDAAPEARRAIEDAHDEAKQALAELRGFVRGLHPAVLDERGLDAALSGIVARSPVPATLRVDLARRPSPTLEAVAYFVVSEALTNIARHSGAANASVEVVGDGRRLVVEVTDDGAGGAVQPGQSGPGQDGPGQDGPVLKGTGLAGLAQRVAAVDGTLTVTSPAGGPTTLRAEMPCVS